MEATVENYLVTVKLFYSETNDNGKLKEKSKTERYLIQTEDYATVESSVKTVLETGYDYDSFEIKSIVSSNIVSVFKDSKVIL